MLEQDRTEKYTQQEIMELATSLIQLHKKYKHPEIIGVKLETTQAIDAAYVTATELARYTAESRWYRVQSYLDQIKYKLDE